MSLLKRGVKRFLLNLFYRRLWVRIAVILLVIVTIPVVLLGVFLINTSQQALRNSVLNNHKEIVARTAEEIGLFVRHPQDILTTAAAMLEVIYPAPWKQETVLVELALNEPIFMRVFSLDLSGEELASSELGRKSNSGYPEEALEEARKGKTYISALKVLNNHVPFITMSVPIRKMGKPVGALIGDVNLRGMWDIVDNIRIGKTGRVFLVSGDGTLIAHQDKKKVLRNENLKSQKEVQSVLLGKTQAIELEDKIEGRLVSSFSPITGLGWGVILRQRQDEAYLFSKAMKVQSWIIIILGELAAIGASIFMGKALAKPIGSLAAKIRKVADGDLDHKIVFKRRDDIGELIRSFNEMTKKLKKSKERERLSAIGEAVAWITHELKNSLVSIKSFVCLIPQRHKDEKFLDRFSKLVPQEVSRMERIFKELSDFSSCSELNITRVNVKEIIDGILEIMKEEFIEKKIDIEYNSQNSNFFLEADPEKLKQVFMNLIINSINAMPEGGWLIVSIDFENGAGPGGGERVKVRIADTGKGMSKEAQNKLFEPFHTTKNGGMGLGLAISRKIIKQHGGEINLESEIGRGTAFIVKLPIVYGAHSLEHKL